MSGPPQRRPVVVITVLAVATVMGIAMVVAFSGRSDDERATERAPASGQDPGERSSAAPLEGECATAHAGHDAMMWNAVMADEMLDAGCPWPYPPFDAPFADVPPDDSIAAAFEPRRYDELWQMLGGLDVGVCEIASVADPVGEGFTFGFAYTVASPGCPDRETAVVLTVREYASRGTRDRAANGVASPVVLGRWVIEIGEGDPQRAADLRRALLGLGGVET